MRTYYVRYHRFCNSYEVVWCPAGKKLDVEEWMRITRRKAIELCAAERRRRKVNPAMSGYASTHIWPYNETPGHNRFFATDVSGYIVEEVIA